MFREGDIVMYGASGACTVREFCKKKIAGQELDYAVLETEAPPKTTIYLPMSNETLLAKIKRVPSPDEILGMIREIPDHEVVWIEDDQQRKERYREVLAVCDRHDLIRLIKTLYTRQQEQREVGKKLHSADERIFREAQRLLHNEISFVMQIPPEEVSSFISTELSRLALEI